MGDESCKKNYNRGIDRPGFLLETGGLRITKKNILTEENSDRRKSEGRGGEETGTFLGDSKVKGTKENQKPKIP